MEKTILVLKVHTEEGDSIYTMADLADERRRGHLESEILATEPIATVSAEMISDAELHEAEQLGDASA
jgi:hypothetical protein